MQGKERNSYETGRGNRRRRRSRKRSGDSQYSEETGYVYRSPTPQYPTAPPYNPEYGGHHGGHHQQMAEYNQPLMRPPPYHDVVERR